MSQSVSAKFASLAAADMQILAYNAMIAWLKTFDDTIGFFTIGTSTIEGKDVIKGAADNILIFDQFKYYDESDHLLALEYERAFDLPLSGLSKALATINLHNFDDKYTYLKDATIGAGVTLPKRPIKLSLGFKDNVQELLQIFVGYTKVPVFDYKNRRLAIKAADAMDYIYNYTFEASTMWVNQRTDQIIAAILQAIGFTSNQYSLDAGLNTVPFAWADKGDKAGPLLKDLCEAELGHIFISETGVVTYQNRNNWASSQSLITEKFDDDNIIDLTSGDVDKVINVVEVNSAVREVQALQPVWTMQGALELPPASSVEVWPDFADPCTTVDDMLGTNPITDSYFRANSASDGSGTDKTDLVTVSFTDFAKSAKVIFTNTTGFTVYITEAQVWGTPAKVTETIYLKEQDDASIAKYEEHPLEIKNNFVSSNELAQDIIDYVLATWPDGLNVLQLQVKGNPQRQLGDFVYLETNRLTGGRFFGHIVGITGKLEPGKFKQTIDLLGYYTQNKGSNIFTIGLSTIEGTDQIAAS